MYRYVHKGPTRGGIGGLQGYMVQYIAHFSFLVAHYFVVISLLIECSPVYGYEDSDVSLPIKVWERKSRRGNLILYSNRGSNYPYSTLLRVEHVIVSLEPKIQAQEIPINTITLRLRGTFNSI